MARFIPQRGVRLAERVGPFTEWSERRSGCGLWPYGRVMAGRATDTVSVVVPGMGGAWREAASEVFLNFGSQDYLGLAQSERVQQVAIETIRSFGLHSAGSPAFVGRSRPVVALEKAISRYLAKDASLILPTGWAAGYGAITGLVRPSDTIVIDSFAHSCLQEGAARATPRVVRFSHNDLGELAERLRAARNETPERGIFVVCESLYSMDADSPDLRSLMSISRELGAIVILDVAHDFGVMGARGLGALEQLAEDEYPEVIVGSFSKAFATNGGFVATTRTARNYLHYSSSSHLFSNAMAPAQAAVALECLAIAMDEPEGDARRRMLLMNAVLLREAMTAAGCAVAGQPSPIVPVFVGREPEARLVSRRLVQERIVANLVEFPAVPLGAARFRFQLMASHSSEALERAARVFGDASREARAKVSSLSARGDAA